MRPDDEADDVAGPRIPTAADHFTCQKCGAEATGDELGHDAYGSLLCPECGRALDDERLPHPNVIDEHGLQIGRPRRR